MKKEKHPVTGTLSYHILVLQIEMQKAKSEIIKAICDLFRLHSTDSQPKNELSKEEVEYLTRFASTFGYDVDEFIYIYTEAQEEDM